MLGDDDVDCVVEVATRAEYRALENRLRGLGFKNSMTAGAPLCRWTYSGVAVDVMPTGPAILGFSNRWYAPAIDEAVLVKLPSKIEIRVFTVPYFLGAKIEAFKGRGKMDFLASRDFEDIVTLLDGRKKIRKDLCEAPDELKKYLRQEFGVWLKNQDFLQSISAHLLNERRNAEGARKVIETISNI